MKASGIILIAGSSSRYSKGYNKNLELINNKPVFMYSIDVMNKAKSIDEILLVIREDEEPIVRKYLTEQSKELKIVYGGSSRQESVYNALKEASNEIAVIHDGARPLIKKEYIDNCLKYTKDYSGVIIGVPVKDTIKLINDNQEVLNSTNRPYTWIAQTPQCFDKDLLLGLHTKYKEHDNITDDASLLELEGIPVKMVRGDYTNIKLTTSDDLEYIKRLVKE